MDKEKTGDIPRLLQRFGVEMPPLGITAEPTQFDYDIGEMEFRDAMSAANEQLIPARLSLAVQLPFCASLCYHCSRLKKVTRNGRLMAAYVDALCKEIRSKSELIDRDRLAEQLWFVGGSPAYLGITSLGRIMTEIAQNFSVSGSNSRYFMVEVDARTATSQYVAQLSMLGINAMRTWVPAMSQTVQTSINREQSAENLATLMMAARRTSFRDVTLATRYGLPMQTVEGLKSDIDWLADLGPDNIVAERYQHRPGLHASQRLIPRTLLPEFEDVDEMEAVMTERLLLSGYEHIGLGHFTRTGSVMHRAKEQGQLQRGLMGYMIGAGADTLGFGAGATSSIEDFLFRAPDDIDAYMRNTQRGGLAIEAGYCADPATERASFIVERMLCDGVCRERDWSVSFDIPFNRYIDALGSYIQPLVVDDILTFDQHSLTVTERGRKSLGRIVQTFEKSLQDKALVSLH